MKRMLLNLMSVRLFSIFTFILLNLYVFSSPVQAVKYAALVMDAHTGKIFHTNQANVKVPPASLTKIATLYTVFEELEAKRLTLDSVIKISKNAAKQPPCKLGIPAGKTILLKEAILAIMTRSANDISVAVAEKISGTEAAFVQRMNRTAHVLGMYDTTFKNTSGLPHKKQITTANNMARLSQALLKRFPTYYRYFGTKVFKYKGQEIHNHNKLLGRVEGLDGIKTGFVCASGFNIATSAVREGRRLIVVVMGGATPQWRDERVIHLLETAFSQLPQRNNRLSREPLLLAKEESEFPLQNVAYKETMEDSQLPAQKNVSKKKNAGDWYVQVGAYKKANDAHMAAALLLAKLPEHYDPIISVSKSDLKRAKHYRARLGGFDKNSADKVCKLLRKQGVSCLALKESSRTKMLTAMVETG